MTNCIKTSIDDLVVFKPKVFDDSRGYFFESYNSATYNNLIGMNYIFIQDNESHSSYGVVRGLHYQKPPYEQTKLVRVVQGMIYDVAVDIRPMSETFGEWYGIELSDVNKKQLLIPQGFAHGFSVLSEYAILLYKCDNFYNYESEGGIIYNDKDLNIDWKIDPKDITISNKDMQLNTLKQEMNL